MKLLVSPKVEGRGLRMRTQPGFNGNILTVLQSGEMLETLENEGIVQSRLGVRDQWVRVRNSDGQTGYCAAWLLAKPGGSSNRTPADPVPGATWGQNPELRFLSRQTVSSPPPTAPVQPPPLELSPISTVLPQFPPQTLVSSSELTPLPAEQPLPVSPEMLSLPATNLFHDVPLLSQGDLYGNAACSPVAACMLLEYYHRQNPHNRIVTPPQLIAMLDPGDGLPGKGMSLSNVTDELLSLGYQHISEKIHASLTDLKNELIKGPLIITAGVTLARQGSRLIQGPGKTIHAMVVKGFNPEAIIVNDPWTGKELNFPLPVFEKMWELGMNGMYVIRP